MNKNIILVGAVVVVVLGIGAWAFLVNSPAPAAPENSGADSMIPAPPELPLNLPPSQENPPSENGTTASSSPANQAATQNEFTITGQNFSFTPSSITVKKGDTVKIIFKNADGFHDLKIDEFNVATKRTNAGEKDAVEFVADKVGAFEYYCSIGNHRAMGMKGTLTVTE